MSLLTEALKLIGGADELREYLAAQADQVVGSLRKQGLHLAGESGARLTDDAAAKALERGILAMLTRGDE